MVFNNMSVLRTKVVSAMEWLMVRKPKVPRDRLWPNVYDAWRTYKREVAGSSLHWIPFSGWPGHYINVWHCVGCVYGAYFTVRPLGTFS